MGPGKEKAMSKATIHVFINRRKVVLNSTTMSGRDLLAVAGFEGQGWDLLLLQGEGDETGGRPVMADEVLMLKNGDHFHVIPGNRTFGA